MYSRVCCLIGGMIQPILEKKESVCSFSFPPLKQSCVSSAYNGTWLICRSGEVLSLHFISFMSFIRLFCVKNYSLCDLWLRKNERKGDTVGKHFHYKFSGGHLGSFYDLISSYLFPLTWELHLCLIKGPSLSLPRRFGRCQHSLSRQLTVNMFILGGLRLFNGPVRDEGNETWRGLR